MYKSTQENADFFDRTANHSTKGSRRGYSDLVNADTRLFHDSPENIKKELSARMKNIEQERREIELEIVPRGANLKNWRVNTRYKYKGQEDKFGSNSRQRDLLREYFQLGNVMESIKEQMIKLPKIVSFAQLFMNCAENILEEEKFNEILNAARAEMKQGK